MSKAKRITYSGKAEPGDLVTWMESLRGVRTLRHAVIATCKAREMRAASIDGLVYISTGVEISKEAFEAAENRCFAHNKTVPRDQWKTAKDFLDLQS